jgi:hypothetical protein
MKLSLRRSVPILAGLGLVGAVVLIGWRFNRDLALATARAAQGGVLLTTGCGPIEYLEAGTGVPLLVVHGSGGGHDQGMAFAGTLARQGVRVIAMSRFGYSLSFFDRHLASRPTELLDGPAELFPDAVFESRRLLMDLDGGSARDPARDRTVAR